MRVLFAPVIHDLPIEVLTDVGQRMPSDTARSAAVYSPMVERNEVGTLVGFATGSMSVLRSHCDLSRQDRGACVVVGNFDGVHRGHHAIINMARAQARPIGAPLGVLTFEPHPRAFFMPSAERFRLTASDTRARRLERLGVEKLYELTFDQALASMTPEEFASTVICDGLGCVHVVVGANFRFGRGKSGTTSTLRALGHKFGFDVTVVPILSETNEHISSSSIREALRNGLPKTATLMLGQPHEIFTTAHSDGGHAYALRPCSRTRGHSDTMLPRHGHYSVVFDRLAENFDVQQAATLSIGEAGPEGRKASMRLVPLSPSANLHDATLSISIIDRLSQP